MRSRNRDQGSNEPQWTREEIRTAFLFWLFWSAYVSLATILFAALLTDWPEFLHTSNRIVGP
jgi:hypothetical protein